MSNNERPTAEVTTESGHKVVYRTYVTAAEKREIMEIYLTASDSGSPSIARPKFQADDKAFEQIIVALDDNTADIVARCAALPSYEYDEIEKVVKGVLELKKKDLTSSETTSQPE